MEAFLRKLSRKGRNGRTQKKLMKFWLNMKPDWRMELLCPNQRRVWSFM
uniref:Uncharacterized protein n=1 Tax=Picea sitchensis TaxID=3332 RepID=A9NSF9_PICSI|nr:unknown [Picea sitchensis]